MNLIFSLNFFSEFEFLDFVSLGPELLMSLLHLFTTRCLSLVGIFSLSHTLNTSDYTTSQASFTYIFLHCIRKKSRFKISSVDESFVILSASLGSPISHTSFTFRSNCNWHDDILKKLKHLYTRKLCSLFILDSLVVHTRTYIAINTYFNQHQFNINNLSLTNLYFKKDKKIPNV